MSKPFPGRTLPTVAYPLVTGGTLLIEFDPEEPCWMCGLPVGGPSTSGTVVCGSCDCGVARDGHRLSIEECKVMNQRFKSWQAQSLHDVLEATGWGGRHDGDYRTRLIEHPRRRPMVEAFWTTKDGTTWSSNK